MSNFSLIVFLLAFVVACKTDESLSTKQFENRTVYSKNCDFFYSRLNLCAELKWISGPKLPEDIDQGAAFELEYFNSNTGELAQVNEIKVTLWSHMLHANEFDSEIVVEKVANSPGNFLIKDIRLSCMGADWDIYVEVQNEKAKYLWRQSDYLP